MQIPTDYIFTGKLWLFTQFGFAESMKQRIINLIHMKDKGILGAFMLF